MKKQIVYLRWLDSALVPEWTNAPDPHLSGLSEIETIGYLILEDDQHVQVAQSIFEECEKYSAIQSIPKSVILERRALPLQNFKET